MKNLCTFFFLSFKLFDCTEGGKLFNFVIHRCMMTIKGFLILTSACSLTFKDSTRVHVSCSGVCPRQSAISKPGKKMWE